ncbi:MULTISPECIES: carbohydrate kinase family protein [Acidiplasma]|uniref:Carbohydrate kinase PfkB domain-containing protein n=2 Tax=Acidiplasma TaxID=507753 RepID=A0A0N8VKL0_9ARCH|nr:MULTISPECIES: carbohydrate kinase family protein [Acidiplasma]KPV46740.1 hypothetical protein SE19_04210 [Acidiplasma aeolicum]KQB34020.1 hypothetical protein AOG55_01615 [Acidiplasma cupricumulans]
MPCKYDLLIIGDGVLDIYLNIKNFPIKEYTTTISSTMEVCPGGTAAMAVMASKLGLKVSFVDNIGNDLFGDYLIKELKNNGVNTDYIIRSNKKMTATSVNIIDDMKRHSFLGYLGSGDSMDYVDANLINDSKSIFFEGYNLIKKGKTYRALMKAVMDAETAEKYIFFDPGPLISQIIGIEKFMNLSTKVFLNRDEAVAYFSDDINNILKRIKNDIHGDRYVLKLDRDGSVTVKNREIIKCPPVKDIKIANTIGAGDAFDIGYISALISGYNEKNACILGNIVAAMRISKGIGSIPSIKDITRDLDI